MIRDGKGVDAALDLYFHMGKGTIEKGLLPVPGTAAFQDAWKKTIDAAEEANEPGKFTAFIGFEWTSGTGGNNLHRNVIFRDGRARTSHGRALTRPRSRSAATIRETSGSTWRATKRRRAARRSPSLTTAMAAMVACSRSSNRSPASRSIASTRENRRRWEPLYEVTQMKGTSEAHPFLSPNDEFASFEIWDKGNLDVSAAKKPEMLEFEYARSALSRTV